MVELQLGTQLKRDCLIQFDWINIKKMNLEQTTKLKGQLGFN